MHHHKDFVLYALGTFNEELLYERMVSMGSNMVTFHLTGEETGGLYSLTEFIMAAPPAPGPPLHIHGAESAATYVLESELQLTLSKFSSLIKTIPLEYNYHSLVGKRFIAVSNMYLISVSINIFGRRTVPRSCFTFSPGIIWCNSIS